MRTFFASMTLLLLFSFQLSAQAQHSEKKSGWVTNFTLSHFHRVTKNELHLGSAGFNISPGLELLYNYQVLNNFSLSSGIFYQYVDFMSHIETTDRFKIGEFNVPFIISVNNNSPFSFQMGTYFGKFIHFNWTHSIHGQWIEYPKGYDDQFYSSKNGFIDLYFGFSYSIILNNGRNFSFTPFVKHRFKENWMDHYRKSTHFGFKLLIYMKK